MKIRGELTLPKPVTAENFPEITGIGALVKGGFPNPADDFFREAINLGDVLIKNPDSTFYAYAWSDSMETVICEGEMILIDRAQEIYNGKYGVFELDGDLLMKRYWQENGVISLHSENPHYAPLIVKEYMSFRAVGRIINTIQTL